MSYTTSPVLHEGNLYFVSDAGLLSNLDADTGTPHYQQQRLPKPYNFKASPVGANSSCIQSFIASPVILGNAICLRSRTHLFRIN